MIVRDQRGHAMQEGDVVALRVNDMVMDGILIKVPSGLETKPILIAAVTVTVPFQVDGASGIVPGLLKIHVPAVQTNQPLQQQKLVLTDMRKDADSSGT